MSLEVKTSTWRIISAFSNQKMRSSESHSHQGQAEEYLIIVRKRLSVYFGHQTILKLRNYEFKFKR